MLLTACNKKDYVVNSEESTPVVKQVSTFPVIIDQDIQYAQGLGYDDTSTSSFPIPLKLDVYYPNNSSTNRPVYMFIHGGGFVGGSKSSEQIVDIANFFASRGWVFVSIDYRLVQNLGTTNTGIAPQEWIDYIQEIETYTEQTQQGIAMYAAQRDAKAALRWIVFNADNYNIDTDYITVGGGSAGAITAITLGISNKEDFRDELTISEDPTLSSTNLNETYTVRSIINFWGSNIKLELFDLVFGLNRYDTNDPELFIAHGTNDQNPSTPFSEATELQGIYDSLDIYSELVPLNGFGHGAWNATVDGKSLSDMSFDFLVERQNLTIE
jgi:predicted esterase